MAKAGGEGGLGGAGGGGQVARGTRGKGKEWNKSSGREMTETQIYHPPWRGESSGDLGGREHRSVGEVEEEQKQALPVWSGGRHHRVAHQEACRRSRSEQEAGSRSWSKEV